LFTTERGGLMTPKSLSGEFRPDCIVF
jgi:hypothetical protein